MSVLLEFAMFPLDKGESVKEEVSQIIKMIDESGADYQLTSMGTLIEMETMDKALELVRKAYAVLEADSTRIYAALKFDIQKGYSNRLKI